jgi:hypothetical protein
VRYENNPIFIRFTIEYGEQGENEKWQGALSSKNRQEIESILGNSLPMSFDIREKNTCIFFFHLLYAQK